MKERPTPLGIADQRPARGVAVNQPDICVIEGLLPLCGTDYVGFLMTHASLNPPAQLLL